MMLEEDTVGVPSTSTWRVDRQSLVHSVAVLSKDSWASTADRHSDSLVLMEEVQKPRNWMRVEDTNTVRLAAQHLWAAIA
jgi:hypothetical protein